MTATTTAPAPAALAAPVTAEQLEAFTPSEWAQPIADGTHTRVTLVAASLVEMYGGRRYALEAPTTAEWAPTTGRFAVVAFVDDAAVAAAWANLTEADADERTAANLTIDAAAAKVA